MRLSTTRIAIATLSVLACGATQASASAPAAGDCGVTEITFLPWAITQPGTYCLASNLTATSGLENISVLTDQVVIDLGGHKLRGPGPGDSVSAIDGNGSQVEIRNGTLDNWAEAGININGSIVVRDVTVSGSANGIVCGSTSVIEGCRFLGMTGYAVFGLDFVRMENCDVTSTETGTGINLGINAYLDRVAVRGGTLGIDCGIGSRVENCSAWGIANTGINVDDGSSVVDSFINPPLEFGDPLSPEFGIVAGANCRVVDCTVLSNARVGVQAGVHSIVRGVIVNGAGEVGIQVDAASQVSNSTASYCGSLESNIGAGLRASGNVAVDGVTASTNFGMGIQFVGQGGRVANCTVTQNNFSGISLVGGTQARWNHVTDNLGMGIRVGGARCLIQGNVVDANAAGIVLQGRRSLILDNHATDNAGENFVLPWGNAHGPLIDSLYEISGSVPQANFDGPE